MSVVFQSIALSHLGPEFTERVVWGEPDECWPWAGGCETRNGRFYGRWRGQLVHRLMYGTCNGPLAATDVVVHRCGVSLCVNVDHMLAVGQDEQQRWVEAMDEGNWLRAMARLEEWLKGKSSVPTH